MNFNISGKPEYNLQASLTAELVDLYGVKIKFMIAEKINVDDIVFGDYSHIKTNSSDTFEIYALPETSETFDNLNINFTQFGMQTQESVNLFVSKKSIQKIYPDFYESKGLNGIIGNLIILPSGRIMEITDCQFEVPGISNLYAYQDQKNAFRLTCITYNHKKSNEIDNIAAVEPNFVSLENYFNELTDVSSDQDSEAKEDQISGTTKVIVPDVDSVFGRF